jgi:hypothetical protein
VAVRPVLGSEVGVAVAELLADPILQAGKGMPVSTGVAVHADAARQGLGVTLEDQRDE